MSLTKEEKEYLSLIDYLDSSYYEMTESAHITKHRDIIDRLVKENEELRRLGELTQELLIEKKVINPQPISGVELYTHLEGYIKHLQALSHPEEVREVSSEVTREEIADVMKRCFSLKIYLLDEIGAHLLTVFDVKRRGRGKTN